MISASCGKELWGTHLFMQPYSSQQALQKEFGQSMVMVLRFAPTRHYLHKTGIWTEKFEKMPGVVQLFSAKLVLQSKAAKTTCCWKCCYHQQNQARIFLARGAKFQHFGRDFCVEIFNLLQEMLLSEFVAGNSISSNMMFLQLLNAQQALQKELHNTKCFSQHFHPEAMYSLHAAI